MARISFLIVLLFLGSVKSFAYTRMDGKPNPILSKLNCSGPSVKIELLQGLDENGVPKVSAKIPNAETTAARMLNVDFDPYTYAQPMVAIVNGRRDDASYQIILNAGVAVDKEISVSGTLGYSPIVTGGIFGEKASIVVTPIALVNCKLQWTTRK